MKPFYLKKHLSTRLLSAVVSSVLIFSGSGLFNAFAADGGAISGLNSVNQDSTVKFSAQKTSDGKLSISNDSASGGFSSKGITTSSFLLTPNKVSGDFSVEAKLTVTKFSNAATGGIVGVGAFSGTGANDGLAAAVTRGDSSTRSYYQKADGSYGAGSPKGTSSVDTSVSLKLARTGGTYTVVIDGASKDLASLNDATSGDMYLGLAISGASATVDSFVIKQGANVLFDLATAATVTPAPTAKDTATPAPTTTAPATTTPASTTPTATKSSTTPATTAPAASTQDVTAVPNGTVVIGNMAYDLNYSNNTANSDEMGKAVVSNTGSVYVRMFDGSWIDNNSGKTVDISKIPALTYKDAKGNVTKYSAKK